MGSLIKVDGVKAELEVQTAQVVDGKPATTRTSWTVIGSAELFEQLRDTFEVVAPAADFSALDAAIAAGKS